MHGDRRRYGREEEQQNQLIDETGKGVPHGDLQLDAGENLKGRHAECVTGLRKSVGYREQTAAENFQRHAGLDVDGILLFRICWRCTAQWTFFVHFFTILSQVVSLMRHLTFLLL